MNRQATETPDVGEVVLAGLRRGWRGGGVAPAVALLVLEAQEASLFLGQARVTFRHPDVLGKRVEDPERGLGVVGGSVRRLERDAHARADVGERLARFQLVRL